MAHFLRDAQVANITIDREALIRLASIFESRCESLLEGEDDENHLFYVIRFDDKGYRIFSIEELLKYFDQAKEIERVIFTVESTDSVSTNRNVGSCLELRLDSKDKNRCYLSVTSDDKDWVDVSFSAVTEVLDKFKNQNSWARSELMELFIQLGGVFVGFLLSLWAALVIAPKISVENAFVVTFLFALLIFSNTWSYFRAGILKYVEKYFPNLTFLRPKKDRLHWLIQTIIGGIIVAFVLFLLDKGFGFLGEFFSQITK